MLSVFAVSSLLISRPAIAQNTPHPDREALIGKWIMDIEGNSDAQARRLFGRQERMVANPKKAGQPQTFRTNVTYRAFDQQEYEKKKREFLQEGRTNGMTFQMAFEQDGTVRLLAKDRRERVENSFRWVLQGRKLTLTAPNSTNSLEFPFTNATRFTLPLPGLGQAGIVFKREASTNLPTVVVLPFGGPTVLQPAPSATSTNAPGK